GHIEEPGARSAEQLDLLCNRFCHLFPTSSHGCHTSRRAMYPLAPVSQDWNLTNQVAVEIAAAAMIERHRRVRLVQGARRDPFPQIFQYDTGDIRQFEASGLCDRMPFEIRKFAVGNRDLVNYCVGRDAKKACVETARPARWRNGARKKCQPIKRGLKSVR